MKKLLLTSLLATAIVCPAFANNEAVHDRAMDIDTKKADVQQKFDAKRDKENQDYEKRSAEIRQKNQDNPDRLNDELQRLEINHNRKIEQINNEEVMKLQKLDEKKNNL